ncbi:MAG: NAD(+)/NADH kinase, partial [Aquificaceae bacterium]
MKRILLFVKDSQRAIKTSKRIEEFLRKVGLTTETFVNLKGNRCNLKLDDKDMLLVIGGDGTFLAGARLVAKKCIPILGINEGRFGFLTEVDIGSAFEVLELLLEGKINYQKRMMLSVHVVRKGKEHFIGDYLNDAVISKSSIARMLELDTYANNEFMMRVYGDGVIVSTPTGSTAYALSAGGPIVYPLSENLLFVPICPHTLSNRPLVLPKDFEIRLVNLSPD